MTKEPHPLTTELTMRTREGQQASMENLPSAVMQALYHSITGRKEKLSKDFDGHYVIRQSDIRTLIEKVEQTLQQFNYQAASAAITIFHHNNEKIALSSLDKFLQYDTSRGDAISEVSIEIEFLLALPQVGTHQSYKIAIDIRSYVLDEKDYVAARGISGGYEASDEYCIRSTVEYIDYVVARSFHSTVTEWVNGLEKISIRSIAPRRGPFWRIEHLLGIIGGAALSFAVANIITSVFPTLSIPVMVSLVASAALLGTTASEMVVEYAFERIGVFWFFPHIILNKGSERNYNTFLCRRQRAARVGWLILGSGVVWVVGSVLSKMILHKLGY